MQVLRTNLACKRNVLDGLKEQWEPLGRKFTTDHLVPWDLTRLLILSDIE
jgi:hypothetical protein